MEGVGALNHGPEAHQQCRRRARRAYHRIGSDTRADPLPFGPPGPPGSGGGTSEELVVELYSDESYAPYSGSLDSGFYEWSDVTVITSASFAHFELTGSPCLLCLDIYSAGYI